MIAGAGKTKLTSKVVDDLRNALANQQNDEALAYFYCDRNQEDRQDPTSILRSFIRQLSVCQSQNALQSLIVAEYELRRQNGFSSGKFTFQECAKFLIDYVNIYPQTTLVLDALDECNPRTRKQLIEVFDSLLTESSKPVKIFISSRPDKDIKSRFQYGPNVGIQATDNHHDIAKFVDSKIEHNSTWFNNFPPALRDEVVQTLLSKSKGM
jgi:ankyrin repeat domain-containing protein 50